MYFKAKKFETNDGAGARPVASAEEWLGRNISAKRRLWERLNPRHRRLLHLLAQALAAQQDKSAPERPARNRLLAALDELERLATRIERLLGELRGPPRR